MEKKTPQSGAVLVMIGTRKGAFLFWSDPGRKKWDRSAHHAGWMVHDMKYDSRDGSIYAATNGEVFGALVQRSDDLGLTWQHRNEKLDYDESRDFRVRKVWTVEPGHAEHPGRVYAGVERAGLFFSDDRGETWQETSGLTEHPSNKDWAPGGGGLCLHTIVPDPQDPQRLYVGVSTGGIYRTDDGGETWAPKNQGVRADFLPDPTPAYGQCVHKAVLHPDEPQRLYQQNHCGVYRSEDQGETWQDISAGLPSRFGFPFAVHAHDPATVYTVPLMGDDNRVVADGHMSVWRSRDGGDHWDQMSAGFPEGSYLTVLREGLAVDTCDPCGIYVGTQTGQVFFSRDEGEQWELLVDFLPPIYSVSTGMVVD
jgi:photosystem II stability/assembly factor-like uncharacterized protein